MATTTPPLLPKAFVWRRLHSLAGLWLVAFLIIHLLANSQAALLVGENGSGFIKAANDIRNLPFLPVLEIVLLGIPFAIHIFWGVKYLFTGEFNSYLSDGSKPALPEYPRNHAYTWQRITSWILLLLITAHVIQMRFMEAPTSAQKGSQKYYMVRLEADSGLYPLSERLNVALYDPQQVADAGRLENFSHSPLPKAASPQELVQVQRRQQEQEWLAVLQARPIKKGQVIAMSKDFGTAELLMVRETFKMPLMSILYTILVLSACFHGFNGIWTFMITWGISLSQPAQRVMRTVANILMAAITLLGLAAIWGTYWLNLKQ